MPLTDVTPPPVVPVQVHSRQSRLAESLSRKVLPSLDGLRAVAVLLVILHHTGVPYAPHGRGVLTFYVLSGFLITWLMLKESEQSGTVSIRNFYVRRVLRIFPAFYIYVAVLLAGQSLSHHLPPMGVMLDYLSSIFYVSNYRFAVTQKSYPFLRHTWALSIEEQFYLVWPWIFMAFHRNLKRLTYLLIGAILLVDIYRLVLLYGLHASEAWLTLTFDSRWDHLLVGCLLAVLLKRGVLNEFWEFITARVWVSLVPFGLTVLSIALAFHFHLGYKIAVGFVVDPLLTAILLVQLMVLGNTWLWGWLNWRAVRYMGQISYGMFLYHMLAYRIVINTFHGDPPLWIRVPGVVFVSGILGAASFHLLEQRFLRLKSRFMAPARGKMDLAAAVLKNQANKEQMLGVR